MYWSLRQIQGSTSKEHETSEDLLSRRVKSPTLRKRVKKPRVKPSMTVKSPKVQPPSQRKTSDASIVFGQQRRDGRIDSMTSQTREMRRRICAEEKVKRKKQQSVCFR